MSSIPISHRRGAIAAAVRRLDEARIGIDDIVVRSPTLDDVFLTLTGRAPEPEDERSGGEDRMTALVHAASDTFVLSKRSLFKIRRQPDLLIGFTVQPVMFVLLFVYVFGGAIATPGYSFTSTS